MKGGVATFILHPSAFILPISFPKPAACAKLSAMDLLRQLGKWALRLAALWVVYGWAFHTVPPVWNRTDSRRDLVLYYLAARSVNASAPLYQARPDYGPDSKPFEYLYPPPFAALIAPLGRLQWLAFARLWTAVLVASFLGYAFGLMRIAGYRDVGSFGIALALVTLCFGAKRALALGQIDPFLWCVFGASVWTANKRPFWSGALLGLAGLIKIYSVWPLFALPKTERAAFWRGALMVGVAGFALGAVVCGFGSYVQWARAVLPEAAQGTFNPDNYSLSMAGLRAARALGWNYAGGPLTGLPKWWLSFAAIAGPLFTIWATRKLSTRWKLALVGCAAAWCAPLCWSTYLPLALVPLALGWSEIARRGTRGQV